MDRKTLEELHAEHMTFPSPEPKPPEKGRVEHVTATLRLPAAGRGREWAARARPVLGR